MARIFEPKSTYTIDYPEAVQFAKEQAEIFWLPDEIEVEKDLHDMVTDTWNWQTKNPQGYI